MIYEKTVKNSEKEKYLEEYLTKFANPLATMESRNQKGEGILSDFRAILEDVPLGKRRLEIGITLREACFINRTLYNSFFFSFFLFSTRSATNTCENHIICT